MGTLSSLSGPQGTHVAEFHVVVVASLSLSGPQRTHVDVIDGADLTGFPAPGR